jgi:predicted ribosomally synthesized peptide with SipW-like signal peptide
MSLRSTLTSSTARKLLVSLVALGVATSVAGLGSWAAFTSSTSASHTVATGTVTASLGAAGTADNRLTIGASDLAAGDSIQRAVTLSNTGSIDWASAALTTTATVSSLLDTDATNGLKLVVESCSAPWTEVGTSAPFTYTCDAPAVQSTLVASRAVIGSAMDLGSVASLAAAGTDYLRVTLTLPASADNTFQGASSTIDFAFDATQRTATAK